MTADGAFNAWFSLMTTVSVLLLVSLGLAVVFGLRRVINLAHGEFIMFGAFATLTATRAGIGLWGAMLIATAVTAAFGLVVELTLIRHLYERPADTMLATWGLSLILVQLADLIYGSVTEGIPTPLGSFGVGDYSMSEYNLVLIGVAWTLAALTWLVMRRTRYGLLTRAAAQNPDMAAGLGVNTRRVATWTFAYGAGSGGCRGGGAGAGRGGDPDDGPVVRGPIVHGRHRGRSGLPRRHRRRQHGAGHRGEPGEPRLHAGHRPGHAAGGRHRDPALPPSGPHRPPPEARGWYEVAIGGSGGPGGRHRRRWRAGAGGQPGRGVHGLRVDALGHRGDPGAVAGAGVGLLRHLQLRPGGGVRHRRLQLRGLRPEYRRTHRRDPLGAGRGGRGRGALRRRPGLLHVLRQSLQRLRGDRHAGHGAGAVRHRQQHRRRRLPHR